MTSITTCLILGFIGYSSEKKFRCPDCRDLNRKENYLEDRDRLISNRNYGTDDLKLNSPSDLFYSVTNLQLQVFSQNYALVKNSENIRAKLIKCAIDQTDTQFPEWFSSSSKCLPHRQFMLHKLFTVKLLKTAIWETDNLTNPQTTTQKKTKKF